MVRWFVILLALALAAISVFYTLAHLKIDTDRKNLISAKKDLILLTDRIDRCFRRSRRYGGGSSKSRTACKA